MPIVPIVIDTFDLARQFRIPRSEINQVCDNIAKTMAASFAKNAADTARNELHQTRERYIRNIRLVDTGRMGGTVMLDYSKDKLIQMLEEGATAFDIKQGMMASAKVKFDKHGKKYITVPFRWGTPGIVGDSDVFSGIMPREVYNAAKKLNPNIPMATGSRSRGLDTSQLSAQYNSSASRPEIKDSVGKILFKEYVHKTSIFQGITKMQDGSTGQNRYFSFRRISERSDPDAFIHPGIEKHNIMQRTLDKFDQSVELSRALDIEWAKLFPY